VIEMPNFATESAFRVPVREPLSRASTAATECEGSSTGPGDTALAGVCQPSSAVAFDWFEDIGPEEPRETELLLRGDLAKVTIIERL
jgi:hypothetical protein